MVDVQNATLAGGVAIGTSCNMVVGPAGVLGVGLFAGLLSVFGYTTIQPALESLGLHDTCGIHNLHGMPGVLAGLVGAVLTAFATQGDYRGLTQLQTTFPGRYDASANMTETRTAGAQAGMQMAYLVVTLAISISSGVLTGYIAKFSANPMPEYSLYDDESAFQCPDDEIPAWAVDLARKEP